MQPSVLDATYPNNGLYEEAPFKRDFFLGYRYIKGIDDHLWIKNKLFDFFKSNPSSELFSNTTLLKIDAKP